MPKMDIFAHGFWTYAIYHRRKYVWLAVLFALLPDLLSFGLFFILRMFSGTFAPGKPDIDSIPQWVEMAYNVTHSLVVFCAVFLVIFLLTKEWFWPMVGWAIHIITDFPTHTAIFFPTPILWPIYNTNFDGISWATSWFMLINYTALLITLAIVIRHRKSSKTKQ